VPAPPRAVFDTVILLQAVTNPDVPSWVARALADTGRIQIVASNETLKEAEDVFARPSVRKRFKTLDDQRAGQFLGVVRHLAEIHVNVPKAVGLERNHKDEPFLDLAVVSSAMYLVTRDKDMLDLMGDAAFTAKYPYLKILGPVELLRELAAPIKVKEEKGRDVGMEPLSSL
jgi:putative PIN family toxin of toxin-antitoxin system